MYLKEAFRYQNFLGELITTTTGLLNNRSITMRTTEEHLRSKTNPDAEDEIVDVSKEKPIDASANDLIYFMLFLIEYKHSLAVAISSAKNKCGVDIDVAVATNRIRQEVASVFARMGKAKATERINTGYGNKFNAEGNQVSYKYDIKETSIVDYDADMVKRFAVELRNTSDDVSRQIDVSMIDTIVEFKEHFDVNGSYEDALFKFREMNRAKIEPSEDAEVEQ